MILVIISHTPHFKKDNQYFGWGPTIREINQLAIMFSNIFHIAPLYNDIIPNIAERYISKKIKFIPIKPAGGNGIRNKLNILYQIPKNLLIIHKYCKIANSIQFRAPTNLGLYVLPYLSILNKDKTWIKYAGNWSQKNPPISYYFQKLWLNSQLNKFKVTINGSWPNQGKNILSFENPCFTEKELKEANKYGIKKTFNKSLILCFVGAIEEWKGVSLILEALKEIEFYDSINCIYFVGDGSQLVVSKKFSKQIKNIKIHFTGALIREDLNSIYKKSHIILLPSRSEGFPKVIAEATAFGCVSIISNVGSLSQYINDQNGLILKETNVRNIINSIRFLVNDRIKLKKISLEALSVAKKFTFKEYNKKIERMIIN